MFRDPAAEIAEGFPHLVQTLRDLEVRQQTRALLGAAEIQTGQFLAAYMFRYFPAESMMDQTEPSAVRLLRASEAMLDEFDAVRRGQSTARFAALVDEYKAAFEAWKGPDQARLVGRIREGLAALHVAQASLLATDQAFADTQAQIDGLEAKLQQLQA